VKIKVDITVSKDVMNTNLTYKRSTNLSF